MAIIINTRNSTTNYSYLNIYPDQFKTQAEKEDDSWIKETMDYFANKAYTDYVRNRDGFTKNYDLVKGILRREDFYETPEVKSFTDMLVKDMELPSYVKHYSILTTPINEMVGELSKRPDGFRIKAFDDNSKSEELDFKTQILQEYVLSNARIKIQEKAALNGEEVDEETLNTMTFESVKDDLDAYTSVAEKWANHVLTCTKADFNIKEKGEDAFRDLLISAHEYFLIDEDNSKVGYNITALNPKTTWKLTTPDRKYTSDPSGRGQGAYAAGTVQVMEISEIIESEPDITKEEIDHLRLALDNYGLINTSPTNYGNSNVTPGVGSIKYDTYDPLVEQTRLILESEMKENNDGLRDFLGLTNSVSAFGYKYVVVKAFWMSKRKVGKLVYIDEFENEQSTLVDEHYISGTIPTQISLEWGWINQWYKGVKIGPDIYHVKPFNLLNYCPIIGLSYELKNTEAKSIVDMMKPFQVLYNICMNQLYKLLGKEIGNVASVNIRRIPRVKDGDAQDDIDIWEMEAMERGIIFDDDSPENTKAPVTNTSVARNVDLTRTAEIQSRYNLAITLKNECWELIGMSKQRLGSISASESATGTNAAITQSYNQTEPIYVAHEYVMGQLYQAIIDASLYIESQKPESTLSYITSQGESAFVQVNGADLKFRDLKVFPTNRPEDKKLFEEIRMLAQPLLQNGGSFHDVIELYTTDSMRQMKKVFKTLRDKQEEFQNNQQSQEQQRIDQEKQIAIANMEQMASLAAEQLAHDDYQKQLDRISKERIAIIQATGFGKVQAEDKNNNQVFDVLEAGRFSFEQEDAARNYQLKIAEVNNRNREATEKNKIEKEKLQVAMEKIKTDLQIAKANKNRFDKPVKKKKK